MRSRQCVPVALVAERMKRCTRCQKVKPWRDYPHRRLWEDGSVRTVQSYCRSCNAVLCREWRRTRGEHPAKRRARQNRWLANLDPERKAIILDQKKTWWRRKAGTTPDQYRRPRQRPQPRQRSPRVPVEPFAEWLRSLGETGADIARVTHLPERSVWRILNEQKRVELDTVDRALLAVGDGTSLSDLYSTEELAA